MFIVRAKVSSAVLRFARDAAARCLSTSAAQSSASRAPSPVNKVVFISQSNDVFANLALEDWLYKRADFSSRRALLLWRNSPCVVIGRHQNPWTETDVEFCSENHIPIARRNSGGGTVYHDMGNLNCTFFMPRSDYDRKFNLEIIRAAVWDTYGLDLIINERDDLQWQGAKVSGTAAKLGREVAYHHCTLLVHSDRAFLHRALDADSKKAGYDSKATASVPARTACLREAEPLARVSDILSAVGRVFLETPVVDKRGNSVEMENGGYQLVNPTDYWYPGLGNIRRDLASWDWIYGKTPEFSVTRRYALPSSSSSFPVSGSPSEIAVTLRVSKGIIVDAELSESKQNPSPVGVRSVDLNRLVALKGQRYAEHLLDSTVRQAVDGRLTPTSLDKSPHGHGFGDSPFFGGPPRVNFGPMGAQERDYVTSILTCA